jgi:hypothetical protein
MKKLVLLVFLGATIIAAPSCSQKSGCPATQSLLPKTNKKGDIIASGGHKSELFPKSMKKKMGH